jgi:hypothetical protein
MFNFDLRFCCRDFFVTGRTSLTDAGTAEHLIGRLEGERPARKLCPDAGAKLIVAGVLDQGP